MKEIRLCDDGKLQRVAELCEKYGFGIEIQAFYDPEYVVQHPDAVEIHLARLKDFHARSLHGPFADLCFGSFDRLIKEATRSRFEYAYELACKLVCSDVVLHHGYIPGTSHYPNWIKRGKVFWQEFLSGKDPGITFHLENMLECDPILISRMVSEIDSDRVDICLDIGHAHCYSQVSVLDWIKILKTRIGYVHMHSNFGSKDEHLAIQCGTIQIREVCDSLELYCPNAIWSLETGIDYMEDSIQWLMENGYARK